MQLLCSCLLANQNQKKNSQTFFTLKNQAFSTCFHSIHFQRNQLHLFPFSALFQCHKYLVITKPAISTYPTLYNKSTSLKSSLSPFPKSSFMSLKELLLSYCYLQNSKNSAYLHLFTVYQYD